MKPKSRQRVRKVVYLSPEFARDLENHVRATYGIHHGAWQSFVHQALSEALFASLPKTRRKTP